MFFTHEFTRIKRIARIIFSYLADDLIILDWQRLDRFNEKMNDIILRDEAYKVIGICMEVHRQMGSGFREIIYKDALEVELRKRNIPFIRERRYEVEYKGIILHH